MILPYLVSSNFFYFDKILSIEVLGKKKLELRVSIKLFIESEISYCNK